MRIWYGQPLVDSSHSVPAAVALRDGESGSWVPWPSIDNRQPASTRDRAVSAVSPTPGTELPLLGEELVSDSSRSPSLADPEPSYWVASPRPGYTWQAINGAFDHWELIAWWSGLGEQRIMPAPIIKGRAGVFEFPEDDVAADADDEINGHEEADLCDAEQESELVEVQDEAAEEDNEPLPKVRSSPSSSSSRRGEGDSDDDGRATASYSMDFGSGAGLLITTTTPRTWNTPLLSNHDDESRGGLSTAGETMPDSIIAGSPLPATEHRASSLQNSTAVPSTSAVVATEWRQPSVGDAQDLSRHSGLVAFMSPSSLLDALTSELAIIPPAPSPLFFLNRPPAAGLSNDETAHLAGGDLSLTTLHYDGYMTESSDATQPSQRTASKAREKTLGIFPC